MTFFKTFFVAPYRWYHGLLFLIAVNILSLGWVFMDVDYFNSLNKPFFTPARWVFGPVWIINNILVIYGNIVALNLWSLYTHSNENNENNPQNEFLPNSSAALAQKNKSQSSLDQKLKLSRNLRVYFRLQAFSWLNYILFTQLSFGTKIPAMFFWASASMLLLTIFSLYYAWQIDQRQQNFWLIVKKGKSITFSLITLLLWLILATALGWHIWQNN